MNDTEFMSHIITEICDYAVVNNIEPDNALNTIADNIFCLLEISTFNNWKLNEGWTQIVCNKCGGKRFIARGNFMVCDKCGAKMEES